MTDEATEMRRELRKVNGRLDELKELIQSGTNERRELMQRKEALKAKLSPKE